MDVEHPLRATANAAAGTLPPDCIGALCDPDGGPYLPWAPHLDADDVRYLRAELTALITALAARECWPHERLEAVMTRAVCGPLADLLPNLSHFRDHFTETRADEQAHDEAARRTWRLAGLDDQRAGS
jgi:hypothetical protein